MAQKHEDNTRDGGSIRVGSTGTISSLMNKELQSSSSSSASVSGSSNDSTFKLRKSMDDAQSSKTSAEDASSRRDGVIRRSPEFPWKTRIHKRMHRVPMLDSENFTMENTPKREKTARKVSIVEVVDTNCGVPAGSLSNRLKRLSFSKLSQNII